jgi:hypothetical protein
MRRRPDIVTELNKILKYKTSYKRIVVSLVSELAEYQPHESQAQYNKIYDKLLETAIIDTLPHFPLRIERQLRRVIRLKLKQNRKEK